MSELERDLRALASHVDLPDGPDFVPGVRARLAGRSRPSRRPLVLAFAAAAVALGAALAVPPARSALLDLLRIGGAEIERVDTLPESLRSSGRVPGRPVAIEEARRRVDFELLTPRRCDHCDTVFLDETIPGGRVTVVWPGSGPRLALMQFVGQATPFVQKLVSPRTTVRSVRVAGAPGQWVAGSPHAVVFSDRTGRMLFGRRLARNVLLWERDGITFRLEGDITLRRALAVARTLAP